MNRAEAYAVVADELERWRRLPFAELARHVGGCPIQRSEALGAEMIEIEVRVRWGDSTRRTVRVEAVANGPSCWNLERLEESIIVSSTEHPVGSLGERGA